MVCIWTDTRKIYIYLMQFLRIISANDRNCDWSVKCPRKWILVNTALYEQQTSAQKCQGTHLKNICTPMWSLYVYTIVCPTTSCNSFPTASKQLGGRILWIQRVNLWNVFLPVHTYSCVSKLVIRKLLVKEQGRIANMLSKN
jgi:hypothetical protein